MNSVYMLILLLTISLLLTIYLLYILHYNKLSKNNSDKFKIDEIYLINLKRRPDRLVQFMDKYEQSDLKKINILKFDAVDGSTMKIESVPLSDVARSELKQIETTGFRSKHYQLTRGALGCYLSHVKVWDNMLKAKHNNIIIFEDDANIPKTLLKKIKASMKYIPDDWDMILFGYYCKKCNTKNNYKKVDRFILLHCYMINYGAVMKILKSNTLFPITQQIDSLLSELSCILNIYAVEKNLITQFGSRTDIQLPLLDKNSKNVDDRMKIEKK